MALMTVGRVDLLLGKRPEVVVLLLKQLDSVTHLATVYTGYWVLGTGHCVHWVHGLQLVLLQE